MDDRDLFDLLLVLLVGTLAYVEVYGLADPLAALAALRATAEAIDVRVYLVVGGVLGICFVGYLAVYLPRRDADRSPR
jgi:hypothetical protein